MNQPTAPSFKEFLTSANFRSGMLQASAWGALTSPVVVFMISGGLKDPLPLLNNWLENWTDVIWMFPLIGLIWADVMTFMLTTLRYWLIPRLDNIGGPAVRFCLISASGLIFGFISVHLVFHIGLQLAGVPPLPAKHVTTMASIAGLLFIVFANMFHVFHLNERQLQEAEFRRREQERNLLEGELMNLNMRIRPHFFFNALNTLAALIDRDTDTAQEFLADLADLFRKSFTHGQGDHLCTWAEEKALLEAYLHLEKTRHGERLSWLIDVQASPQQAFPAFLLQPLMENAVHHGIGLMREPGRIQLSGSHGELGWSLSLTNPTPEPPIVSLDPGHALANIRERLQLMRGDLQVHTTADSFTVELQWQD